MRRAMLVSLPVVLAALTAPKRAPAQSLTPAIEHVQLTVQAANDEWTETELVAAAGDLFIVRASGRITIGAMMGQVDANGTATQPSLGRLQIKVGSAAPVPVGANGFIVAAGTGPVKLRVFDTRYDDNSGAFQVQVIHVPASLIPPAKPAGT